MSDNNLTIKIKSSSKRLLLIGAFAFALVSFVTVEVLEEFTGDFAVLAVLAMVCSIFCLILWINSSFESLTIDKDSIRYRYFLFVSRSASREDIDKVTLCERSGALRFFVNDRKFASLNLSVVDVSREDFEAFAKKTNLPIEYIGTD